jgi:hypothetical protein
MAIVAQSKARKAKIEMASNTDMQLVKDNKASAAWLPVKVSTTMVHQVTQDGRLGLRCAILEKKRVLT